MSFPKASIKRFNENKGCAPPPGAYDPKNSDKATGGVVDKTERFKTSKDAGSSSAPGSANSSTATTPVKQLFAPPQSIKRPPKTSTSSADTTKVKELEKEIRRLLKERTDQDKLLSNKDEEVKKLEGRLQNASSDKSSLQAKLAAAEKELQTIKKSNELLKNKLTTAENNKKQDQLHAEVTSLKHQLQQKDHEITQLRRDLHLAVSALVSDLQNFETCTTALEKHAETYGSFVKSLINCRNETGTEHKRERKGEKKKDIEDKLICDKISVEEKVTLVKKQSQMLSDRFTRALKELEGFNKQLESTYTSAITKKTELTSDLARVEKELLDALDVKRALEEQKADLLDSNGNLNDKVKEMIAETQQKEEDIRNLQSNIEELKEDNAVLQSKLQEADKVHQQTLKEDADRILSLEERELVIQVVTKGLNERIVELQAQNEDLLAALKQNEDILIQTKEQNQNLEGIISELKENFDQERTVFINQFEELEKEKLKVDSSLVESEQQISVLQCDLKTEKANSETKVKELQEQLEVNKTELEQLQNKLGDLVYEKSQLHMEIGHMEAKLKLINCESEKAREDAENAFVVIPKLKEEINTLLIEKKNAADQIGELIAQNSSLQGTLEVFQSDFDVYAENMEKDKNDLNHKIVELTEEVDGLKEQKDQMAKELDDWLTEKSELDIDIAKLQCRIKVLEMENEQSSSEAEKLVRCQKDEIERLREEKHKVEHELTNKTTEIKSLQTEIECKTADHVVLEEKFRELELALDQEKDQLSIVTETNRQREITLERQTDEITAYKERSNELQTTLETQKGQLSLVEEMNNELEVKVDELERKSTEALGKNCQLQAMVERKKEEIISYQERNGELQRAVEKQKEELSTAERRYKCLEGTVDKLENEISEVQGKNKQLQAVMDRQKEEMVLVGEKNNELEMRVGKQTEQLKDTESRLRELQQQYDSMALTIFEQTGLSKQRRPQNVASHQGPTEQVKDTESRLRELQQQYDSKCEEYDSLTETCERLQGDLSIVSKTMTVIETKLAHVEENLARKSEECVSLKRQNKELDYELTVSVKESLDLAERVDSLLRENERLQVYEAEIEDLRQQLAFINKQEESGLKEEAEKYKKLYDELIIKIEPFMDQLDSFEMEKQFLLGRSQATEEAMEKLKQNYCELLGHQNKKQKIKHIVKLKDENSALRKEVATLREQTVRQQRMIEKSSSGRGKDHALSEKSTVASRGKENAPLEKSVLGKGKENTPKKSSTPLKSRQHSENTGP